jgi:FMN-dependent NADH-azoreductase
VVAGRTFQYGPDGVVGLAGGKRVIAVHTRGGLYSATSPGAQLEHAESHLRAVLGFIGVGEIEVIVAEGLAVGDHAREAALAQAREGIADLVGATRQDA